MAFTLTPDELVGFNIMVGLIKATRSANHEIVMSFCKRKGITVDELLDIPGKNGTLRRYLEPVVVEGDDQIARLKRTGLVDVNTHCLS